VLEAEETARARGARIYGEVAGYGACSDGKDMVQPDARGAARAMRAALESAGNPAIDYINTHSTSTPLGDMVELDGIRQVFGDAIPPVSSTKGLTGHAIAASGAQEAIYCLLMMERGFLAASANLFTPDSAAAGVPILRQRLEQPVGTALSNSIGFGGTSVALVFRQI
jgi:3-oxoacyl-[acyl-carrier-protein] synthase-1